MTGALRDLRRAPESPALGRYREIAEIVTGVAGAEVEEAIDVLDRRRRALRVPSLGEHGASPDDLPSIVAMSRGGSMKYNLIMLTDHELISILQTAMNREAENQAPP